MAFGHVATNDVTLSSLLDQTPNLAIRDFDLVTQCRLKFTDT